MAIAALAAAAIAVAAAVAPAGARAAAAVTPAEASALGQQAYLYGLPLLESLRVRRTGTSVRCPNGRGGAPVNAFSTATRFATPAARAVVAPSVDTLYSIAYLDLGRGPVVLGHPDMGRRYFVFQLLDPYTNTIGYVGARTTGSRARRFAISWSGHPGRRPAGARVIRSPSRRVWLIGRTLAEDGADRRRAVAFMRRYTLAPPGGPRRFAPGCRPGRPRVARTPTGLAFLDALSGALAANPPPAADRPLLGKLARVGVGPGLRPRRAHLSAAALAALVSAVTTTGEALPGLVRTTQTSQAAANHGWAIPAKQIGDYGIDYTYRAAVALLGLGANTPAEAMYPTAFSDATGQPLDGDARYRVTFPPGQTPPARAFWSLTAYDEAGHLVANAEHRYAVGPTHPPLVRRADGSIVVVLQRTEPDEPGVNWLPTPPGRFRVSLRLYWPRPRALDGVWQPPPVELVAPAPAP